MNSKLPLILLFFINYFSFAQDSTNSFVLGKVDDGDYYNSFFNCKLSIPSGWKYEIDDEQEIFKEEEAIDYDEEISKNKYIDPEDVKLAFLVIIKKYGDRAPVKFNPNLIIMAENIEEYEVETAKDYAFISAFSLILSNAKYKLKGAIESIRIGGKEFYYFDTTTKAKDLGKVRQRLFFTIHNNFGFGIILTYKKKDGITDLMSMVNSLEF